MYESFDHAVSCAADRDQIVSSVVYRLMMGGIYQSVRAVELVEEISAAETAVIDMMELVAAGPLVALCSDDVLKQIAAEMDIDKLKAFTDAEHVFAFCDESCERLELQDVQNGIHMAGAVICLTEEGGGDIAASGKEQMRRAVSLLGIGRSEVGDIYSSQCHFIVSGIRPLTEDDNGEIFTHDSFPRQRIVTFIVCGVGILVDCFCLIFQKKGNTACVAENHSIYFYRQLK